MLRSDSDTRWWLDEINLDPDSSPIRMSTRSMGEQPWLLVDERFDQDLAVKAELHETRPNEVFSALDGTENAGELVEGMVVFAGIAIKEVDGASHPIERAGLSVQEDLCLLRRHRGGWYLEAASLSFPSQWRLSDKIGRSLHEIHGPTAGYAEHLAARVSTLIDRLGDRIVRRRHWFIYPNPALFQPSAPPGGDLTVPADEALDQLHLRSERQTIRRVGEDGWALFTIRIQQCMLRSLFECRGEEMANYVAKASQGDLVHRGMIAAQVHEIRSVFERRRSR